MKRTGLISVFCLLHAGFSVFFSRNIQGQGMLQFRSGFEPNVAYVNNKIVGIDQSSEAGKNDWDKITDYLDWAVNHKTFFEGGAISITADPGNSQNNVLCLYNTTTVENYPQRTRSQWTIGQNNNWVDDGKPNRFEKQFYRYRMYIPGDITKVVPYSTNSPWYMIWESHAWDLDHTRHGLYITKKSNSNLWYFRAVQELPEGTLVWESDTRVEVPFDRWFTLESYFKYHETEGEFYISITDGTARKQVVRFKVKTKNGSKMHDQMLFKSYHNSSYLSSLKQIGIDGTRVYYDDFEIWSDYPPSYWEGGTPVEQVYSPVGSLKDVVARNNPFRENDRLVLSNLPVNSNVIIYALNGTLIRQSSSISTGEFSWNGEMDNGHPIAAGLYLAKIEHGNEVKIMKILFQ
jgi:hypothetical protein